MFSFLHVVLMLILVGFQDIKATPTNRQKRPLKLFDDFNKFELDNLERETITLNKKLVENGLLTSLDLGYNNLQRDDLDSECFNYTIEVTDIVYEEKLVCNKVSYQNCFKAFKTVYKPQNVTTCVENFRKDCYTDYEDEAHTETVRICKETPQKDCHDNSVEACETVQQTVCQTTFTLYNLTDNDNDCKITEETICEDNPSGGQPICRQVPQRRCNIRNKSVPSTECIKVPLVVCGPENCPVQVSSSCNDVEKTFVIQVPKERCSLQPFPVCTEEVVNLPSLKEETQCSDVPKSICQVEQVNPHKETRPVIKKWCKPGPPTPTPETLTSTVVPEVDFTTEVIDFHEVVSIPGTPPAPLSDYEY